MKLSSTEISEYTKVQEIARDTIEHLKEYIQEGLTEIDIVQEAEKWLRKKGAESFWYHGIGAFVFIGNRTTLSVSGKNYTPTKTKVQKDDIVTIDLSPEIENRWGDFARTFIISNGVVCDTNDCNSELNKGIEVEKLLHHEFKKNISEENTFEDLFEKMNALIESLGYENLDFSQNLGHTIERNQSDRIYIESGNTTKFKDIDLFTFEPHIKKKGGQYGFKQEDIYYFQDSILKVL